MRVDYAVEAEEYQYRSLEGMAPPIGSNECVRKKVAAYPAGDTCSVWYDARRPHRAAIRPIGWLSYLMPVAALLSGAAILSLVEMGAVGWVLLGCAWVLFHDLAVFTLSFFQDAGDVIGLARRRMEPCITSPNFVHDEAFFESNEQQLLGMGFHDLGAACAPLLSAAHHENIDRLFVADDRRTLAVVGEVRYQRKLLGVIRLPFLGHRGLYYHSRFPDGSLIETMRGNVHCADPDPVGKISNRTADDSSVEALYLSHLKRVAQYETEHGAMPREYRAFDDCVASLQDDIEMGHGGPPVVSIESCEGAAVMS